jgi:hypothetical protein
MPRAIKYHRRGYGLALPQRLFGGAPDAARAAAVFAAAKLALLLARDAPLGVPAVKEWRERAPPAHGFTHQAMPPPGRWCAGFTQPEEGAKWPGAGVAARRATPVSAHTSGVPVEHTCALVNALYASGDAADAYQEAPRDFPELLQRRSEYGVGAPDMPYGPPPESDDGDTAWPLDLSSPRFVEEEVTPRRPPVTAEETAAMLAARAPPPTEPEPSEPSYGAPGIVIARTAEELREMLAGGAAFAAAQFADMLPDAAAAVHALAALGAARTAAGAFDPLRLGRGFFGAPLSRQAIADAAADLPPAHVASAVFQTSFRRGIGQLLFWEDPQLSAARAGVAIHVLTAQLPPLLFPLDGELHAGTAALRSTCVALGCTWRTTLRTVYDQYYDSDVLSVELELLAPPPHDPTLASFLTLPAPGGAPGRLLPLNIVLEIGGPQQESEEAASSSRFFRAWDPQRCFLDSHTALAADAASEAPRAWCHYVWWHNVSRGVLRVHLQACGLQP